ncbi:hypothetical protein [Microbacterium sp. 2FI]|uniref:hypothetical protein n=1 Tax=Microbacterium sp. 2FI TaxID=2502193 RepID=UPI0010F5A5C7|nr:hypothetical protein [Microbacterium sp. 2FI]
MRTQRSTLVSAAMLIVFVLVGITTTASACAPAARQAGQYLPDALGYTDDALRSGSQTLDDLRIAARNAVSEASDDLDTMADDVARAQTAVESNPAADFAFEYACSTTVDIATGEVTSVEDAFYALVAQLEGLDEARGMQADAEEVLGAIDLYYSGESEAANLALTVLLFKAVYCG